MLTKNIKMDALRTQILFALKSILKNRSWFLINLIGFSLAFAITFLIISWASFELSYDNFYKNRDRIYRVIEKQNFQGQDEHYLAQVPEYLSNTFEEDIPEIEASTCLLRTNNLRINLTSEIVEIDKILYADNKVSDIFAFDFIAGNSKNALSKPYSIVLTWSTALTLFKSKESALGKAVELDNKKVYTVTGIIKDIPENSHLQFNALLSLEERKPNWNYRNGNHNASCYVLLKPNTKIESINQNLQLMVKKWLPYNAEFINFQLQPLKDIHLDSGHTMWEINWNKFDRKYVNAFIIVALLILLIVVSNYINLTLAYSTKRNIEIGLKKIIGSRRSTLVAQFFTETSLLIILSLFVAFILFENTIPVLQKTVLKSYNFHYSDTSALFYVSIILVIFIVELSGIYPSVILTSYSPVSIIKKNFTGKIKGYVVHKILTVTQFVIAIILIVSLIVIVKQLNYIKSKNLGYSAENVVLLTGNDYIKEHYDEIKAELLSNPSILDVTFSNTRMSVPTWRNSIDFEGREADSRWEIPYMCVDYNFADFYKMQIVRGRNFSQDLALDKQGTAFLINESLAKRLGFEDPVGKKFRNGETGWGEIVGVVKDFNFSSLHDPIEPILFYPSRKYMSEMSIKAAGTNLPATLKYLESKWAVYNPGHAFQFSFLDNTLSQLYTKEEDARRLIFMFSVISLFLSVIGLFGMVRFFVKRRTKEIGIRKINGAQVSEILAMLNIAYTKWAVIAFIFACPVSWFIMQKWLQNFAYKTELNWWIFALAGVIVLGIAFLTTSFQSMYASTRNPVEALRYE